MRIAYIGLSSPIFYDYKTPASKAPSDTYSSPNPILDSAFGLFLLYDELWFVCRSVCPENMRNLPYVKFLDESGILPSIEDIPEINFHDLIKSDNKLLDKYETFYNERKDYWQTVKNIGISWKDVAPDNHTHSLQISGKNLSANSLRPELVLFDLEILKRIGKKNVELITNTFNQIWLENSENPLAKIKLSELLVIENIPNYLTKMGPYHPCVEEARDNSYLKSYRKWISQRKILTGSEQELVDIKREVQEAINEAQDEIFLKHLNPRGHYTSIGKLIGGIIIDIYLTGASSVVSLLKEGFSYYKNRDARWQGFIVSTRSLRSK